jgi:serine kinase of HPr protein (carbohydrate metabolism regulator)
MTNLSSDTLHASCVARNGRAILIAGRSGAGKSDLALRLIDRGALLVSDDYTLVRRQGPRLLARAPATIEGKIEVRGVGIATLPIAADVPVSLYVDLDNPVERLPAEGASVVVAGFAVPILRVNALEASAPIKIELALDQIGLPPE